MEQKQLEEIANCYRAKYRKYATVFKERLLLTTELSYLGRLKEYFLRIINAIQEDGKIGLNDGAPIDDIWFDVKVTEGRFHAFLCVDVGDVTIPIVEHQDQITSEGTLAVFELGLYLYSYRTGAAPFCNQYISQLARPFHLNKPALASIKGHPYILQGEIVQNGTRPVFSMLSDGANEIDPLFSQYPVSEKGTKYIPLEKIDFLTYVHYETTNRSLDLERIKFLGISINLDWVRYMYYHRLISLEYVKK